MNWAQLRECPCWVQPPHNISIPEQSSHVPFPNHITSATQCWNWSLGAKTESTNASQVCSHTWIISRVASFSILATNTASQNPLLTEREKTRALSNVHAGKRGLPLQTPSHSPIGQWLLTANEQTIVQSPQAIKLVTQENPQASHPRFLSPQHWRYWLAYRVTSGLSAIPRSRLVA